MHFHVVGQREKVVGAWHGDRGLLVDAPSTQDECTPSQPCDIKLTRDLMKPTAGRKFNKLGW
jgi:hypothetical protein